MSCHHCGKYGHKMNKCPDRIYKEYVLPKIINCQEIIDFIIKVPKYYNIYLVYNKNAIALNYINNKISSFNTRYQKHENGLGKELLHPLSLDEFLSFSKGIFKSLYYTKCENDLNQ